ncbi:hypothetical protein ERO13_A12G093425v2 [Gossypium hirsutum]|uniref:60 kDa chaperonin n=1 Tax=Gossypium hirsutum TaxID=3635 RepID=A0ABM2Z731_GOSHI|nr:60 kDa chaperonin-like [Gossypium hirsutum]KAG4169627.1 hypothetical protein ERO13_A12G093425v2 [Gossypium hirsutum]
MNMNEMDQLVRNYLQKILMLIWTVAFKLSKRKDDDNLQMLHIILFRKKAKPHSLKRNIGQFLGYVWIENEEEVTAKLLEFLESSHATIDVLLAVKEQAAEQDYEKEKLNKRIAKLSGGVAVIQVGASTDFMILHVEFYDFWDMKDVVRL